MVLHSTKNQKLVHGSLFSGIGGFEKGAELAGIQTLWNCEYEAFNRSRLKKHWPDTEQFEDVRTLSRPKYVDIISGGFPCQDISVAGGMEGITGSRSGLWSEMFRICGEVGPKYIIIENSPALTIRGLEKILCDLSQIGYNAEWQCISNFSFGYPHERQRLYIIAYSNKIGSQSNLCKGRSINSIFKKWASNSNDGYSIAKRILEIPSCDDIRNGNGFRDWTHRVGAIGNAVNPTLAYYLFDCIVEFDQMHRKSSFQG